jgi:hypothetical protein
VLSPRLAHELGEDEDWLWDVATEMEQEDGLIWVYGKGDEGIMAFSDDGIESLQNLIDIHRENEKYADPRRYRMLTIERVPGKTPHIR